MDSHQIVQKLWNLCDVLRDDGINYSDYVTELVLLLFIKMMYENNDSGVLKEHTLPEGCRWENISNESGINLLDNYKRILLALSTGKDAEGNVLHEDSLISAIYGNAQTRIREPRHLEQMIKVLDSVDWYSYDKDALGNLYEGLLEKNANEMKRGAGQYFTPRPLIRAMIDCIKPQAGEVIQDPAAGTAGFLIFADRYIKEQTDDHFDLTQAEAEFQKNKAFIGVELVPDTRRLALMNCLFHNITGENEGVVRLGNSLGEAGKVLPPADVILANPPFGSSKGGEASITRDDLTFTTGNKQLAFLQHIYRNLKPGGRAAIVLPDNVLFEEGIGTDIRRDLMDKCQLHTILRLPTGIFYAQGVKTNVLFFTKGTAENPQQSEKCTANIWVYDLRTNIPSLGKRNPFSLKHLEPFITVYGDDPRGLSPREEGEWSFAEKPATDDQETLLAASRWRCFSRDWIAKEKNDSLDILWLKDQDNIKAEDLPEPEEVISELKKEFNDLLLELENIVKTLEK